MTRCSRLTSLLAFLHSTFLFLSPKWGWSSELLPKSLLEDTFNFDALLWKSGNSVVFVELWGEISAVHKNHFIFSKLQPSQKNHLCNVRDMNLRLALYDWMIVNFFMINITINGGTGSTFSCVVNLMVESIVQEQRQRDGHSGRCLSNPDMACFYLKVKS